MSDLYFICIILICGGFVKWFIIDWFLLSKNLVSKFHRNGTELKILKTGEIANETGERKEQLTVL